MSKSTIPASQKRFLIIGGIFIAAMFILLLLVGIFGDGGETTPEPTNDAPIIGVG